MENREAVIDFNEPPLLLVVEVISPSSKTDDYRSKRSEYGVLEIPEYWIVDPIALKISLCILDHEFYDLTEFQGEDMIRSPIFPNLMLTACLIRPFSDTATARRPDVVVLDETVLSSEPRWEQEPVISMIALQ